MTNRNVDPNSMRFPRTAERERVGMNRHVDTSGAAAGPVLLCSACALAAGIKAGLTVGTTSTHCEQCGKAAECVFDRVVVPAEYRSCLKAEPE